MKDIDDENLSITLNGKDTIEIVNRLCAATGMTPSCLISLLLRKSGHDLESWIGYSLSTAQNFQNQNTPAPIELPTDPGQNLPPVEL